MKKISRLLIAALICIAVVSLAPIRETRWPPINGSEFDGSLIFDWRDPMTGRASVFLSGPNPNQYYMIGSGRVPEISRNADRIVYTSLAADELGLKIFDVSTQQTAHLTPDNFPASYARFSGDGKSVVFFSDSNGKSRIWQQSLADASLPVQITFGPKNDYDPMFTSDDKHLYFTSDRSGKMGLYRLEMDNGESTEVVVSGSDNIHGSLSADNQRLIWRSDRDGTFQIYEIVLATGEVRKLTRQVGSKRHPSFSYNNDLAIYTVVYGRGDAQAMATDIATLEAFPLTGLDGAVQNAYVGPVLPAPLSKMPVYIRVCLSPFKILSRAASQGPREFVRSIRALTPATPFCLLEPAPEE